MLAAANIAFFIFHTALILFNVFGWIPAKWREWNLVTLLLTLFSWVVMGIWKGMGYCICTEWHWGVRSAMGIRETADSYLILLIRSVSGWDPPIELVNRCAMIVFAMSLAMSIGMNFRDRRKKRMATPAE